MPIGRRIVGPMVNKMLTLFTAVDRALTAMQNMLATVPPSAQAMINLQCQYWATIASCEIPPDDTFISVPLIHLISRANDPALPAAKLAELAQVVWALPPSGFRRKSIELLWPHPNLPLAWRAKLAREMIPVTDSP